MKQEQEEKSRLYILPLLLPALMTYDDAKKKKILVPSAALQHILWAWALEAVKDEIWWSRKSAAVAVVSGQQGEASKFMLMCLG